MSMDDIVPVTKDGQLYALFFKRKMPVDGARFLTPPDASLQVGVFERPKGHRVHAHRHAEQDSAPTFGEFLYFEKGKAKVTVFDAEWEVLAERIVQGGDFLLFLAGGHMLEILEPARIVEVKHGPYPGEDAAKIFRDAP